MSQPGVIICSRLDSRRIPEKALADICGRTLLERLIENIEGSILPKLKILIAVPDNQLCVYQKHENLRKYLFPAGYPNNPMKRMLRTATEADIDPIIRVTHDKIFVDSKYLHNALLEFKEKKADYLYTSHLPDGCGFEIFSRETLEKACLEIKSEFEHISYAIKAIVPEEYQIDYSPGYFRIDDSLTIKSFKNSDIRLLIDYEDDLSLIRKIYYESWIRKDRLRMLDVVRLLLVSQSYLKSINKLPLITVYTCVKNGQEYFDRCISSVLSQTLYKKGLVEYILIDDGSKDDSLKKIIHTSRINSPMVRYYINPTNMGLAYSSNLALDQAKGKYIIRMDIDDTFCFNNSLENLYSSIVNNYDVIYPSYICQREATIKKPTNDNKFHCGGALFKKSALQAIRFNPDLKIGDGDDIFNRSKDLLKIGHFNKEPIFFYSDSNQDSITNKAGTR